MVVFSRTSLVLVLALALVTSCRAVPVVAETFEPTPSPAKSVEPTASAPKQYVSYLPDLPLPGIRPARAGEYGWTGALGSIGGLHAGQTELTFAVADDCFAYGIGPDAEPVPVTVAGLDGLYIEPYEDPGVLLYHRGSRGAKTTGAYSLPVVDRTLCVYLTWGPETTHDELEAASQVVESIRAQPLDKFQGGIRINFTLPAGWDTG